jgi:hypothetical protein
MRTPRPASRAMTPTTAPAMTATEGPLPLVLSGLSIAPVLPALPAREVPVPVLVGFDPPFDAAAPVLGGVVPVPAGIVWAIESTTPPAVTSALAALQ